MKTDCIFCRIVAGEIPSATVLETAGALAFLDIRPIARGHTLVIPRSHVDTLIGASDAVLGATIAAVRRVAAALLATGADGVNVLQSSFEAAGQEVFHLHFHVIPRWSDGRPRTWASGGVQYRDDADRADCAARLRQAVLCAHPAGGTSSDESRVL